HYHHRMQRGTDRRRRRRGSRSGHNSFGRASFAGNAGDERGINGDLLFCCMSTNGETIIEVEHLVRKFGDRAVLDGISFNVHRGETLVIMGGSGCGKSTLLRHMIGSMKPTSGSVKLFGEEITAMKEREVSRFVRFPLANSQCVAKVVAQHSRPL